MSHKHSVVCWYICCWNNGSLLLFRISHSLCWVVPFWENGFSVCVVGSTRRRKKYNFFVFHGSLFRIHSFHLSLTCSWKKFKKSRRKLTIWKSVLIIFYSEKTISMSKAIHVNMTAHFKWVGAWLKFGVFNQITFIHHCLTLACVLLRSSLSKYWRIQNAFYWTTIIIHHKYANRLMRLMVNISSN